MSQATIQIVGPRLAGRDRYLGGALCPVSGAIYCAPGSARRVLKIEPTTGHSQLIGEQDLPGKFKWLRANYCPVTQTIICIPSCASQVLMIDPRTDRVTLFGALGPQRWKWHGAIYSSLSQKIYAIPCNASHVLSIDPKTASTSFIGPTLNGQLKWYGAVEGFDGCIYAVPSCASQILCIDPRSQTVSVFGDFSQTLSSDGLAAQQYQWHGGVLGHDGCLYCVPSHHQYVMKVDPVRRTTTFIGEPVDPGLHRPQGKYKYGGAVVAANGMIYCLPSDADRVLKIDPIAQTVQCIGPAFALHNKWQNGYLAQNNMIFAIPCNMNAILQIDPATDEVSLIEIDQTTPLLSPAEVNSFEKWEGGVVDLHDQLWCVPQNAKCLLKVRPRL